MAAEEQHWPVGPGPDTPGQASIMGAGPTAAGGPAGNGQGADNGYLAWENRTRIFLTPWAPPSIIGLFGFMGATLMVAGWQAGWYGGPSAGFILFPFAVMFGGLMQGGAAWPSLRARDGMAAAVHATWGAFWLGFGLLFGLGSVGIVPIAKFGAVSTPFAFWFIILTVITANMALVAAFKNWSVSAVLAFLALGSGFTAAGWWVGGATWLVVGGYLFAVSAVIAWYTATAMVVENMVGRPVLPLGAHDGMGKKVPPTRPVAYRSGMPGVKVGQ